MAYEVRDPRLSTDLILMEKFEPLLPGDIPLFHYRLTCGLPVEREDDLEARPTGNDCSQNSMLSVQTASKLPY